MDGLDDRLFWGCYIATVLRSQMLCQPSCMWHGSNVLTQLLTKSRFTAKGAKHIGKLLKELFEGIRLEGFHRPQCICQHWPRTTMQRARARTYTLLASGLCSSVAMAAMEAMQLCTFVVSKQLNTKLLFFWACRRYRGAALAFIDGARLARVSKSNLTQIK